MKRKGKEEERQKGKERQNIYTTSSLWSWGLGLMFSPTLMSYENILPKGTKKTKLGLSRTPRKPNPKWMPRHAKPR